MPTQDLEKLRMEAEDTVNEDGFVEVLASLIAIDRCYMTHASIFY